MYMQTQTDPHTCFQIKRHTNVQFLIWCWVLGQDVSTRTLPCLPFHTGQAQFPPGLLQPALHSSNSTTQKRARALSLGFESRADKSAPSPSGVHPDDQPPLNIRGQPSEANSSSPSTWRQFTEWHQGLGMGHGACLFKDDRYGRQRDDLLTWAFLSSGTSFL